jgi:DNA (cytosine-5)-methyltransferase 1
MGAAQSLYGRHFVYMNHASLFTGIGGFDLAAEWMGWKNIFQVEINPFCQKVLQHHFPKAKLYEDITDADFRCYRQRIDILSAGMPCQPFSNAGKRRATEDPRFLWQEVHRAIREIAPTYILFENVAGLLTAESGLVFQRILSDMEGEGYQTERLLLPATAKGAPHKRYRLFIIAYANDCRTSNDHRKSAGKAKEVRQYSQRDVFRPPCSSKSSTYSDSGCCGYEKKEIQTGRKTTYNGCERDPGSPRRADWFENFPTEPPICSRNDGFSKRLDRITFPKWQRESIAAYGNAVVPPLIFEIFKQIANLDSHFGYSTQQNNKS